MPDLVCHTSRLRSRCQGGTPHDPTHPSPRAPRARLRCAARCADTRTRGLGEIRPRHGDPDARRRHRDRAHARLDQHGRDVRLRQRVDLGLRADVRDALHGHARRQERQAVAGHELRPLEGQADLHVPPAPRRAVPQRQRDDVRRRQVLARRRAHHEGRLGLHRRRHQERDRQGQVHRRRQDEVPVGAARRRHRAVLERDRAQELRRQDQEAVLHRAGRHRAVQVGSLDARQGAQARPLRQVLAEGQAVPEQRHLDERARRQHPPAAAEGRPGAGRRVPRLVAGRAAQGDGRA